MKDTISRKTGRAGVRVNQLDLVSFIREGWDVTSQTFYKVRSAKKRNQGTLASVKAVRLVKGLFIGRIGA